MIAAASFFVDTNVLLYAHDNDDPVKQAAAQEWNAALWANLAGRVSWQVIVEFYSNAVQKARIPPDVARAWTEDLLEWTPEIPSDAMLSRAWHWCDTAQINFWDAMILAAAEQSGAEYLLSEDFQANRRFGSVTVVNPFTTSPAEFFS